MHGPLAGGYAVNIERINSHELCPGFDEPLGRTLGQVRMSLVICVGAPVAVPSRVEQHRAAGDSASVQRNAID